MSKDRAVERIQERKRNAVDPVAFLLEAGVIEEVDTEEELTLTQDFEASVQEQVDHYTEAGVDEALLADIFGVDDDEVTEMDRPYTSYKIIYNVRNWASEAALTFDAAAHTAMQEFTDEWDDVPPRQRYRILKSLRSFQDECFFCSGEIVFNSEVVQSCCSERNVMTIHCDGCDRRFLEFTAEEPSNTNAGANSSLGI